MAVIGWQQFVPTGLCDNISEIDRDLYKHHSFNARALLNWLFA